ncbi:hypothetical protein C8R46DRAFT_1053930, partial [Mycena filopes]
MGKRNRDDSDSSDASSASASDSDDYTAPATRRQSPQKKAKKSNPKVKGPSIKAEVTIRATDTPLDRMDSQKRCSLASHEQTGEAEARAALRMASKLLERHNVTQAEVMSQESEAEQLKRRSTVSPTATVSVEAWSSTLASAMNIFFDCQSYNTRFNGSRPKVDWAFYGLAEQTVAAAHAYEMTYNLILSWSLKPEIGKGVHAKNCYRTGVARGLYDMAKKEKAQDKERAKKREQALLEARQEQEAEDDKARIRRLEGHDVKVKVEAPDVALKPEPDRRAKMEEVDDDDFGGQRAFEQAAWTPDGEDETLELKESMREVAPDFNEEDDHEHLLDLDAEKPKVKRSESIGPSRGSMGPPASTIPLGER